MQPDDRDLKYLWDMLDAATRASEYVAGMDQQAFQQDRKTRDAVERTVEIVGEAARNVSEDTRGRLPSIQWRAIVATRHILAHEYGDIQSEIMWRIATVHLPELIAVLQPFLDSRSPSGPDDRTIS